MIHVNSIAFSLFTTISSNSVVVSSGFTVDLGQPFPGDINFTPWAGVQFPSLEILPFQVSPTPWLADINFDIIIQDGSMANALDALDRTMKSMYPILQAVNSNKHLDNTVRNLVNISAAFEDPNLEAEDWFHSVRLSVTYQQLV